MMVRRALSLVLVLQLLLVQFLQCRCRADCGAGPEPHVHVSSLPLAGPAAGCAHRHSHGCGGHRHREAPEAKAKAPAGVLQSAREQPDDRHPSDAIYLPGETHADRDASRLAALSASALAPAPAFQEAATPACDAISLIERSPSDRPPDPPIYLLNLTFLI
ncbi:MAG: hypothetical protein U0797_00845 [Gemmataceae bacterium]